MDSRSATRFGLMRHGLTFWNRDRRIQGQGDSPLTVKGIAQVRLWADRIGGIHWHRILTSDMGRARQTASILNERLKLPLTLAPGLREQNWGVWSGLSMAQIRTEDPQRLERQSRAGMDFCPPGGESWRQVRDRVWAALRSAAHRWGGETILVVTHVGVIKCLVYDLTDNQGSTMIKSSVRSAHLHWFVWHAGRLCLEQVNAVEL